MEKSELDRRAGYNYGTMEGGRDMERSKSFDEQIYRAEKAIEELKELFNFQETNFTKVSQEEVDSYFLLFKGTPIAFSTFKSLGMKEAIFQLLTKGELVGQFTLDHDIILSSTKYRKLS